MLRDNIFSYLILKLSSGGTLDRETLFVRGDAYAADAAAHVQAVLRRSTLGSEALRRHCRAALGAHVTTPGAAWPPAGALGVPESTLSRGAGAQSAVKLPIHPVTGPVQRSLGLITVPVLLVLDGR